MLELKNLSYKKNKNYLLKNVNLTINEGEIISIIGKETSGKTLLLNAISAGIHPSEGEILYNGNMLSSFTKKNRYKIIAHSFNTDFNPGKTVYNIISHARLGSKSFFRSLNTEDITEINKQISFFNLSDLKFTKFNLLSKGEKKRTELAYLFARDADIILLENPEQNLDLNSLSILSKAMHKEVINGHKIIIMENSSINTALENSDRIICMQNGSVLFNKKTDMYTEDDFKNIFNTELYLTKNMMTGRNMIAAINTI